MATTSNGSKEAKNYQLNNGDTITMNGVKYTLVDGVLMADKEPVQEESKPSFKLVFRKSGGFGFRKCFKEDEVDNVRLAEDNKTCVIDIYPLLEYLFGKDRVNGEIYDFAGCEYEIPNELGMRKVSFGDRDLQKLERELGSIIDSVFTNAKQAASFKTLAYKALQDPFVDFGHLLW